MKRTANVCYSVTEVEQRETDTVTSVVFQSWSEAIENALIKSKLHPRSFFVVSLDGKFVDSLVHNGEVYE